MLTAAHCPGWPRAERPQTNGPSAPASLGDGRAVAVLPVAVVHLEAATHAVPAHPPQLIAMGLPRRAHHALIGAQRLRPAVEHAPALQRHPVVEGRLLLPLHWSSRMHDTHIGRSA